MLKAEPRAVRAVRRIPIRSIKPSPLTVNFMAEERYRELLKDVRERPDAIAPILLRSTEGEVPFDIRSLLEDGSEFVIGSHGKQEASNNFEFYVKKAREKGEIEVYE